MPVVDVHHPDHGRDEQRGLGPEVVLEVGVEVQVILGQVGEDRHVEAGARDPAEAERVARYLHRGGGDPALGHDREQRLQVGSLRRGQGAGHHVRSDFGLYPAYQTGPVPGRGQAGFDQVRARGLAARPGHADQPEPARRVPVHPARDLAQPGTRVVEHEDRHPAGHGPGPAVRVGQHRDRARGHRIIAERGPVHPRTRQGRVQVAGAHRAGVEGDSGDGTQLVRRKGGIRVQPDAQQRAKRRQRPLRLMRGTDRHGVRLPPIMAP